jgi:hypothetical protein
VIAGHQASARAFPGIRRGHPFGREKYWRAASLRQRWWLTENPPAGYPRLPSDHRRLGNTVGVLLRVDGKCVAFPGCELEDPGRLLPELQDLSPMPSPHVE